MHLFKLYFDYMNDPEKAVQTLLHERSFALACAGYFTAALGWVLFFNIGDGLSPVSLVVKLAIVFVAELTAGYFIASLCGLFLDFSNVQTSPAKLFVLIGSAGFIKSLLIAFALISAAVPSAHLGWLAPLALLGVFGLQLGYLTRAIKRAYHISYSRAFGAWVFTVVPVMAVVMLTGVFFVWAIMWLFS
jgi:hypothetical protein